MNEVQVIQIWETFGEGQFKSVGQPLAIICNGHIVYLKEGLYAEKTPLAKDAAKLRFPNLERD